MMKKAVYSALISVLLAGMLTVSSANAFEKGENRIANGDFEFWGVGTPSDEWVLAKGG